MKFQYWAYRNDGTPITGEVEAYDRGAALNQLRAAGWSVFELKERSASRKGVRLNAKAQSLFSRRINVGHLFVELSLLMGAGMSLAQALEALAEDEDPRMDGALIREILATMASGASVASAFDQTGWFSKDTVAKIASGDSAGSLKDVFSQLAQEHNSQVQRTAQVREAIAYPAFLLFMMLISIALLTFALVPAIEPLFDGSQLRAPLIVSVFTGLREFLERWFAAIALLLIALVVLIVLFPRFRSIVRRAGRGIADRTPYIGGILRNLTLAQYLRSFSMLLRGGASMIEALSLSATNCDDPTMRRKAHIVQDEVSRGQRLSDAYTSSGLLPAKFISLIRAGDAVNRLPDVIESAASIIHDQQQAKIRMLLSLLTPVMTITLGGLIGGLVVSVLSALLDINSLALP